MELAYMLAYPFLFFALFFEVFLLLTYIEGSARSKKKVSPHEPTVTMIVPCFNEEHTVARTIESLLALAYPKEKLNIIAVDDGSTDGTWQSLQAFKNNPRVMLLQKENGGKHTAMNHAFTHATSEIIGCLDADSYVDPEALRHSVLHFADSRVAAVTPNIQVHSPQTIIQRIQHAEYSLSAFVRRTFGFLNAIVVTPGPFSLFRTETIRTVGPWREGHTTEDYEIALRLQAHGAHINNEPQALVYTKAPPTLYRLFRQRVRWVYGFIMNTYDYRGFFFDAQRGNIGMLVLPFAVTAVLGALFLFSLALVSLIRNSVETVQRVQITGVSFSSPSFDLFFVSTTALVFITLILILLTTTLIIIGRRLSNEQPLSINIVLYMLLFGLIAPLWLFAASWKAVRGKTASWR